MAKHFGQNDIQKLLQHLNKYDKTGAVDQVNKTRKPNFPFQNKVDEDLKKSFTKEKQNSISSVSVEQELRSDGEGQRTQAAVVGKKRKKNKEGDSQAGESAVVNVKKIKKDSQETKEQDEEQEEDVAEKQPTSFTPVVNVARLERSKQLRASCLERLMEAQFRNINEYLYSNTSVCALTYMNETLFEKYHEAYRKIAQKWPVKPLGKIFSITI